MSRHHGRPIRILTAVPICDGHDSAITTLNPEFVRSGIEVIYLGYHRSVRDVVRAAVQEDVQGVGLSSYNGGHVEFFLEVLRGLRERGAGDIGVFGGGGGTISPTEARQMRRRGVQKIFFAGTPLKDMVEFVRGAYAWSRVGAVDWRVRRDYSDRALAKALTAAEAGFATTGSPSGPATRAVGITGPGGAGKSTLIDELTLRFLEARPAGRLAILSHDPGAPGGGALLGDRATMIYAQDDRVFMRSLATHGKAGGLAPATRTCLGLLKRAGFDLILVESAGIGQEDLPFPRGLVDRQLLVMSPDYGGGLQLQKTMMFDAADLVVVNKFDRPAARTALAEIERRLAVNGRGTRLIATVAKRHRDPGVDQLFREVMA